MSNNVITTNQNVKTALTKSKNLLDITKNILTKKSGEMQVDDWSTFRLAVSINHEDVVEIVTFISNSEYVLSSDGTMKLWDMKTGKEVRTFEGNSEQITSLALTFDGKYIVTGGYNEEIILWNLYTGEKVREYHNNEESIPCMDYATDIQIFDDKIISSHNGYVKYWDINSGEIISGFGNFDAISPDHKTAVTFNKEYGVIWDIQSGEKIKTLNKGGGKSRFSPDGKYIVSKNYNDITIWDAREGEIIRVFDEKNLTLWGDYYEGYEEWDDYDKRVNIGAFDVTPDSKHIVAGNTKGELAFWNIQSGEITKVLYSKHRYICSIGVDSTGKHMVTGGLDGDIVYWNLESYEEIRSFTESKKNKTKTEFITFSQDGDHIILSNKGRYYSDVILDINHGSINNHHIFKKVSDNRYSITISHEIIHLIDTQNGEIIRSFSGDIDSDSFVEITPDNNYVISVARFGSIIKIWDLHNGQEVRTIIEDKLGRIDKIAITLDSRYVALCDSWKKIFLVDLFSGKVIFKKDMSIYNVGAISSHDLLYDINSKFIVANPKANAIKLFDLQSGELLSNSAIFEYGKEWISWTQNGDYICSDGAEKYFCFVDDSKGIPEVVDMNHPVYKQKKKKILMNDFISIHD